MRISGTRNIYFTLCKWQIHFTFDQKKLDLVSKYQRKNYYDWQTKTYNRNTEIKVAYCSNKHKSGMKIN